jgi:hypothetical protein
MIKNKGLNILIKNWIILDLIRFILISNYEVEQGKWDTNIKYRRFHSNNLEELNPSLFKEKGKWTAAGSFL